MLAATHSIGNHCGHQRFDRSKHCDGDGWRNQRSQQVKTKLRHLQLRQAGGNSAESRADRFHWKLENGDDRRPDEERHDVAGHFFHVSRKDNDECEGQHTETCFKRRESPEIPRENFHARQEFSGNFIDFEPKEILDLSAGDNYGNSICETDYHRPRNEFHRASEPGYSQNYQQHARHQRTHVQAVQAVPGDNPVHNDNERPGRSADLGGGTTQRGNQKACNDRRVKPGLRRDARSNCESHRERKRNQADGDSSHNVRCKFPAVVILEALNRFREPVVVDHL